ncbi:thioredoxin family protein [Thermodesulfobacteriota bacterium]
MDQDDIIKIKIGGQSIGVMGLRATMEEMVPEWAEEEDQILRSELLKRLSKKNYIPDKARETYSKAFLREFKKFIGEPFEEENPEGLQIRVLGPGCSQCDSLEQKVMEVLAEMKLPADMEHVRDIKEIGKYGVMGTPALVINGEVKSVGRAPSKDKIAQWINDLSL